MPESGEIKAEENLNCLVSHIEAISNKLTDLDSSAARKSWESEWWPLLHRGAFQ